MHDRISQKEVNVGKEQRRAEGYPTTAHTLPLCPLGHKFRLDDTVRLNGQTGSLQDRSRRLKQDSWLSCWLFSVVTGEHDGQLDCCSAQYFNSFSLAAQTAALSWFGQRTSIHLILLFLIRLWY